jgi:cytochrome c biogenesis protein CcmG/thiol:disulfide interchange protein DsbE
MSDQHPIVEPVAGPTVEPGVEPADGSDAAPVATVRTLRRTRRVLWAAVAVALPVVMLLLVLATRQPAATRAIDSPLLGKPAPQFTATSIDGRQVSLSEFRGRWVVLNFFATWCIPCREEHPELVRFQQSHAAAGDAQVLAVVYSDSAQAVKDFRARHGGDWPYLEDAKGSISVDFGVSGVPESFLVSPDGVVASKIIGGVRGPALEQLLDEAKTAGVATG